MSSISSIATGAMQSPRAQMDARISAAVSSGTISATDQDALGTALNSIDSSLESERSSGAKPSGDMKSKMDDLIQKQVDAGTLTDDQATELKGFFAQGPKGGGHGPHGPHGSKGAGGPPPPPPSDDDTSSDGTTATNSTGQANDASDQLDAVISFLTQLRDQSKSGSTYDGNAETSALTNANGGLVLDMKA